MPVTQTATVVDFQPQAIDLCFTREDSFPFSFDLEQDGAPIDLTGGSALLTVDNAAAGDGTPLFQLSPTNALDTTGRLTFAPSSVQMDLAAATYYFDVQWTDASSNIRTVVKGKWIIGDQITGA